MPLDDASVTSKARRYVAVLNLIWGMGIPVLLIVALDLSSRFENILVGMVGFCLCLAIVWWRIYRVYQVIE